MYCIGCECASVGLTSRGDHANNYRGGGGRALDQQGDQDADDHTGQRVGQDGVVLKDVACCFTWTHKHGQSFSIVSFTFSCFPVYSPNISQQEFPEFYFSQTQKCVSGRLCFNAVVISRRDDKFPWITASVTHSQRKHCYTGEITRFENLLVLVNTCNTKSTFFMGNLQRRVLPGAYLLTCVLMRTRLSQTKSLATYGKDQI